MERVNQAAKRHVSVFSKVMAALADDFSPLRETALGVTFRNQNAGATQQSRNLRELTRARVPQPEDARPQPPAADPAKMDSENR